MNLWFEWNGIFLCAPPKCGGTALYCSALGIDPCLGRHVFSKAQELTKFYENPRLPAFMSVRDPVERFGSLWRDKCRDGDENMKWLSGMTPDDLMDHIEKDPEGNSHWFPQRFWWREGVEVVSFRQLHARVGLPIIRVNVTQSDDTPLPVERIKVHYHMDYGL